tara:strand:+ start:488 stop:814 length:327 start_codon:yes stop_codon:yes gene_type:complete
VDVFENCGVADGGEGRGREEGGGRGARGLREADAYFRPVCVCSRDDVVEDQDLGAFLLLLLLLLLAPPLRRRLSSSSFLFSIVLLCGGPFFFAEEGTLKDDDDDDIIR